MQKLKAAVYFIRKMNVGYSRRTSMQWVMLMAASLVTKEEYKREGKYVRDCNVINLCDPEFTEIDDPAKVNCGQTKNTATRDVTTAMNVSHINSFIMFNVLSDFIRWRTNPPSKDPTVPEPAKTIPTNK